MKLWPILRHQRHSCVRERPVELALAKRNSEQHVSPEIAQDSEAMLKAMKEAEHGCQRAIDKIAERAGLTKRLDTRR